MLLKRICLLLIVILIMLALFPSVSVIALGSPLQQDKLIAYHPLTGMVRFMGAQSGTPILNAAALQQRSTPEQAALSFFTLRGSEFGIADARNNLKVLRQTQTDNHTSTVRFQQTYQGIPILAGETIVHMDSAMNVLSVSADILPDIKLDITPVVNQADAIQSALEATSSESGMKIEELQASSPELWIYNPAILTPYAGPTVLTWRIEVTPKTESAVVDQLVLVDAKLGGITLSFDQVDYAKNRLTYNGNNNNILPGTLICNESNPTCSGGVTDAVNAHLFASQTYDFYMSNFGRDGINGAGLAMISTINYDDVPGGATYKDAFWTGTQMVYGPGFASADDVVAHEFTHGVTHYESGLFYFWQSGAMNESFSDVFGEFMDLTNGTGTDTAATRWQVGEDLPVSVGVVRSMKDPTLYNDPDKMTSPLYYTGNNQSSGVHTNGGVNNKAAYLMTDGGTFNGQTVTGLGISKVAKIYYYAQTNLLTSGADYADLYYALQASCAAQIGTAGITASDCQEVFKAVTAVEMNLQPVPGYNPDTPACDVAGEYPVNSFYDDMENGLGNWVSGALVGTNHWSLDWPYADTRGVTAHSGQHFLFADDAPAETTDSYIQMTDGITIPPDGKLLFHHGYAIETSGDGGVLEYSVNGGSSWNDAGSLMDGNGYDAALASATNPLNGRQAFTGVSNGYISTRLNLSSLAGQNVIFRWRIGLNSANHAFGWWLDDVQLYQCLPAPYTVSLTRANPSPSSANTVDFTVTFSQSVTGVDASDFNLTTSGVSGAAVSGVSGSGSIYTVTVATGSGSGTIRLNVVDNDSISNSSSTPLGSVGAGNGDFTVGETYTITKTWIFGDVPLSYWANNFIERLYNAGITGGCSSSPLNYCPANSVTRAQMAIFLVRAKHGIAFVPPTATGIFSDVPVGSFGANYIEQLANDGITSGCGGSKYCPNQIVTRAQMAIFLVRAKHGIAFVPSTATGVFADVPVGSFGANYIEQLVTDGITSGCGGSNYCPSTTVKRDSMAVFLVRTFNLP